MCVILVFPMDLSVLWACVGLPWFIKKKRSGKNVISSLRDINMCISLSRKWDSRSSSPWLSRSFTLPTTSHALWVDSLLSSLCRPPVLTNVGAEIPQFWCLHPPSVFPWPCRCGADPAVCGSAVSSCGGRCLELGAAQGSLRVEQKGLENLEAITQKSNPSICCKACCHLFKPDLIAVKHNIHLLYSLWCSCVCCSVYLNERQISP